MSFDTFGLRAELVRAVDALGFVDPTPIQQKSIPVILDGRDVMASARTGTGKTAAFVLPILQRLSQSPDRNKGVRALILAPTRELAAQVHDNLRDLGKFMPVRSIAVFGGVNINPQITKFRRGVDVLVATPGRLIDHMQRGTVDLRGVDTLVLDEADRMLDMGFLPAIQRILKVLPKKRQTLLFSATFSREITQLASTLLHNPERIETAPANSTVEAISQKAIRVDQGRKRELLSWLIGDRNWSQVLVFTRTKHGANRLARQLVADGIAADAIHGNKSQAARTRALADFKNGKVRALIATDIAARGLDIDQLPHVVNFEMPHVPEDYVHRIGRTGRAGRSGLALSLVAGEEQGRFEAVRKLVKTEIPAEVIDGFEPVQQPSKKASGQDAPRGRRSNPSRKKGGPSNRNQASNKPRRFKKAA